MYQLGNLINRRNIINTPEKNVNASEDFIRLLVNARMLTASTQCFALESLDGIPPTSVVDEDIWLYNKEDRMKVLYSLCKSLVNRFVDLSPKFNCKHSGIDDGPATDHVNTYAQELLSLGMFYMEYTDAIHEGDGYRVLQCWKYMFLLFKATRHTNYAVEAFTTLVYYYWILSPR